IARTHAFSASVLSVVGQPVRPCHYLGAILGDTVPVHDGADLITRPEDGEAVASTLVDHAAVLLRGNGQVVVGSSIEEATVRALYLEEAARMQVAASSIGEPRFLDRELLQRAS